MSQFTINNPLRNFLLAVALTAASADAQSLKLTPNHANGIYRLGEKIVWEAVAAGDVATNVFQYTIRSGSLKEIAHGTLSLTDGHGSIEAKLEQSGTLLAEVRASDSRLRALGGAVAAPEQIPLSAPCPADFDQFWQSQIARLESIPANPVLQPGDSGKRGVDYWKITMNNIHGSHIQGQLARPHEEGKLPALLIVQWAGVYPLQKSWAVERARHGWLVLNIEAHDLPIDEPESFYKEQSDGPLKNYPAQGNDSRETSYFLRMYLSCYRAAQYLTERPDWNGKTLAVMGDSQGGMQTLVTAGLHPKITAALPLVPAGCDMLGPDMGRKGGWPQWYDSAWGRDVAKVHEASRYYDAANFAARIKCPVLIGLGLIDETCPPAGVLAAANQIHAPKEIVILPDSPHQDAHGSQAPYRHRRDDVWLPALQQGQMPPIAN